MSKIKKVKGRQVFDSRGNPTVEAEVFSENGNSASAIVPSGASTGTHEAFELRDKDNKKYLGKSVLKAVENINGPINKALKKMNINEQKKIDQILINLDGSEQKKNLGANAILAASIVASLALCANIAGTVMTALFIFSSKPFNFSKILDDSWAGVNSLSSLSEKDFSTHLPSLIE